MDKFIHRENLALLRKRLGEPCLTDAQRQTILRLLTEEHANLARRGIDGGRRAVTQGHARFQPRPPCPSAVKNIHSHERSERVLDPYQGISGISDVD
jgi:hypothetical protein